MARSNEALLVLGLLGASLIVTGGCLESLAAASFSEPLSSTPLSLGAVDHDLDEPGARAPHGSPSRYVLLPDVTVSPSAEPKLERVANAFHRRTGKVLVVTSGTRDPKRQAQAMFHLLDLGTDIVSLYKNSKAARDLKQRYDAGRGAAKSDDAIVADMTRLIERQMARGVFVSAHLRAGAVDIRNRDMSDGDKRAFVASVGEVTGIALLEEARPPHYHLEIQ